METNNTLLGSSVVEIAAGFRHTCALKSDGRIYCWGRNHFGQLGDGTTTDKNTPVATNNTLLGSSVVEIGVGIYHTCALKSDGTVYCWGYNGYGQLGDGTGTGSSTPVATNNTLLSSSVVEIAAGESYTCALKSDGTVYCWGVNFIGQLGDGTGTHRSTPVATNNTLLGSSVVQITAGANHACALKSDGTVYCWGRNHFGQLGDGTGPDKNTPVATNNTLLSSSVVEIAAGENHACALKSDGTVYCWGDNYYSQLGDGTGTGSSTPVATNNTLLGSSVVQITAGFRHTCALKSDGTTYCWGLNVSGQLGDGTTTDRTTPVQMLNFP